MLVAAYISVVIFLYSAIISIYTQSSSTDDATEEFHNSVVDEIHKADPKNDDHETEGGPLIDEVLTADTKYEIQPMVQDFETEEIHATDSSGYVHRTKEDIIPTTENAHQDRAFHERQSGPQLMYQFHSNCIVWEDELQRLAQISYHVIDYTLFLYSAFLDNRKGNNTIRIIAIKRRNLPGELQIRCHFRSDSIRTAYISSAAEVYEMNENHGHIYGGFIISCPVPDEIVPCDVIVTKLSVPGYRVQPVRLPVISIHQTTMHKKKFNVCVSPLFGNISEKRLIEFIELGRILGADHFTFYDFDVISKLTSNVLSYYSQQNLITVIPWKLPFKMRTFFIWYNGQVVAINDCLYRSMAYFSHTVFIDLDEMIVPQSDLFYWQNILKARDNDSIVGFSFQNAIFPVSSNNDADLVTLETEERVPFLQQKTSKVMVKPKRVFEIGIHHVSRTWPDGVSYLVDHVDSNVAILNHYKDNICTNRSMCKFTKDQTVPRKYGQMLKEKFRVAINRIKKLQ